VYLTFIEAIMESMTATREALPGRSAQDRQPSALLARRLFERRCERYLRRLLPGFCAVFGICVLADGIWSYLALDWQTPASLVLRLTLVAIASFAYWMPRAGPPPAGRTAFVYAVHAAALATTARPLADGLLHAMPVLFVWMIAVGLVEPRPGSCLRILAPASLLYAALGALMFPSGAALAVLAGCVAAPALAIALGSGTLRLRREIWLRERQLLHACRYDNLSGALSRGYLTELAQHDLSLAKRHVRPLGVAMLDLDHFKNVNDSYGHAVGDAVIRALTATCMKTLRTTDYVGRIGGEEFVCVLPEAGAEEACACAERVREAFADLAIPGAPHELRCTVSIGIAVFHGEGDWDALLREADAALYEAKTGGRNRVVLAEHREAAAS
jgi:diguanylate cyclase (GGDEF)-like protein